MKRLIFVVLFGLLSVSIWTDAAEWARLSPREKQELIIGAGAGLKGAALALDLPDKKMPEDSRMAWRLVLWDVGDWLQVMHETVTRHIDVLYEIEKYRDYSVSAILSDYIEPVLEQHVRNRLADFRSERLPEVPGNPNIRR